MTAAGTPTKATRTVLADDRHGVMVWTAPYGIAMCQNEVVEISDKGAVREPD